MPTPRICVLRAPGTNCDHETAFAFQRCGAVADRVHLFRLLERPSVLQHYQVLCIPGGFSYGDDIGAGVIFSRQLRFRLGDAIAEFLQADKLALGICNGFQVLLKAGILPGETDRKEPEVKSEGSAKSAGGNRWDPQSGPCSPPATLTWNENGKYTAIWVRLRVTGRDNVFLRGLDHIELPVAHAEGKVIVRDPSILHQWRDAGQIALCYEESRESRTQSPTPWESGSGHRAPTGPQAGWSLDAPLLYPANPNGSEGNVAGLSDPSGRVLGLMPHPERFIFATQHPQWTRLGLRGDGEGLKLFRNAVSYFGD